MAEVEVISVTVGSVTTIRRGESRGWFPEICLEIESGSPAVPDRFEPELFEGKAQSTLQSPTKYLIKLRTLDSLRNQNAFS
jgi:hypothetical protein